jgi:hypothetical protein
MAACPPDAWCEARTKWVAEAAGHERQIIEVLERPGATPADDDARTLAADVLFYAGHQGTLPDAIASRIFTVARATRPSPRIGILLARVVMHVDAERLGLVAALRELVSRWPGTPFQTVLVEELREHFPASSTRVEILADLLGRSPPPLERSAIEGLARDLPKHPNDAACAALVRARQSPSASNTVYADIRIASAPCGALRGPALDDLDARANAAPMPGVPWPNFVVLSYLCASDLPANDRERSIRTLHTIALSKHQPMPVRREAMESVRTCAMGSWRKLRVELLAEPNAAVHDAVRGVDAIIIDH